MATDLLIRGGRVVTRGAVAAAHIAIAGGQIAAIRTRARDLTGAPR